MNTEQSNPQPRACATCIGTGGTTVDTSGEGVTRQHWQTCQDCRGTGVTGGGR